MTTPTTAELLADLERARSIAVALEQENAHLTAELAPYRALDLGDLDGRVSAACTNDSHPVWLRRITDARGCGWCRVVTVIDERDRLRAELAEVKAASERFESEVSK